MTEKSIQLILHGGNAHSLAMVAVAEARKGNFEKAEELLAEAYKEQNEAHRVQTELLTEEAQGVEKIPNILLVHALDHVSAGSLNIDWASELIELYKRISALEEKEMK